MPGGVAQKPPGTERGCPEDDCRGVGAGRAPGQGREQQAGGPGQRAAGGGPRRPGQGAGAAAGCRRRVPAHSGQAHCERSGAAAAHSALRDHGGGGAAAGPEPQPRGGAAAGSRGD